MVSNLAKWRSVAAICFSFVSIEVTMLRYVNLAINIRGIMDVVNKRRGGFCCNSGIKLCLFSNIWYLLDQWWHNYWLLRAGEWSVEEKAVRVNWMSLNCCFRFTYEKKDAIKIQEGRSRKRKEKKTKRKEFYRPGRKYGGRVLSLSYSFSIFIYCFIQVV